MDRSLGFGSTIRYFGRPIQTRFRYAYAPEELKLAPHSNSLVHYAKGTPLAVLSLAQEHRPSTACRFMISGSISLPFRGSFRLSLTVLVHFRSDSSI